MPVKLCCTNTFLSRRNQSGGNDGNIYIKMGCGSYTDMFSLKEYLCNIPPYDGVPAQAPVAG